MSKKNLKCIMCGIDIYPNKSNMCLNCLQFSKHKSTLLNWLLYGKWPYHISSTVRGIIRTYILDSQLHRCAICGMSKVWNNKPINFILDHIDGDASNNNGDNLRLICPNCDSQLPTYKSKNKKSARNFRNKC